MLTALARSFAQLPDPRLRGVVLGSILAAMALLAALTIGATLMFATLDLSTESWIDWIVGITGGLTALILAVLLFPATVIVISSLVLDKVATAVEARHYPSLPPARDVPLRDDLLSSLRLAAKAVVLNLLALVIYLLVPGINLIVFYLLNGYLLGNEYAQQIALRRMSASEARVFRKSNSTRILFAGIVIALLATIPFVALLTPVLATAFMVHIFQNIRERTGSLPRSAVS